VSPFNLSPLALVASLCGLVALAFAGYFLTKRLRQELGGPRHASAAWGIIAVSLIGQAVVLFIGWNERSLITLGPAAIIGGSLIRIAPELTPRLMQMLALAAGALPPLALTAVHTTRAYQGSDRADIFICAVVLALMLLLVTTRLWAILRPVEGEA
jgi:hypothetical protein